MEIIIRGKGVNNIVITGYYNADQLKGCFWKERVNFTHSLSSDSFIYLCPSWLDHIPCSSGIRSLFSEEYIDYKAAIYDHFPVCFRFNVNTDVERAKKKKKNVDLVEYMVKWCNRTDDDMKRIKARMGEMLTKTKMLYKEVLLSNAKDCRDENHLMMLDHL